MAREYMANRPNSVPVPNNLTLTTADGKKTINYLTKSNDPDENSIAQSQEELMDKVENNNGLSMVGKKGNSFPMIEKDPVEIQKEKIMQQQGLSKPNPNRAGSAVNRNILVNDPNNPQPMNKVAASTVGREQMFNEMAMNKGESFPQPSATTTPPAPIFPNQQGSFAAYANPKRAIEDLEIKNPMENATEEGGLKDMIANIKKKKNTKVGTPVTPKKPEDPAMYDGLSKALVGDQVNLPPHLQKEILNSSGMYDEAPALIDYNAGIRAEKRENKAAHKKAGKARKAEAKAEVKQYKKEHRQAQAGARKVKVKGKIEKIKGVLSGSPAMYDHSHTKITKHNVNSAMKDDAAHISYLKRDINYDNKHGGSNKQMTADEKHISKLAGDIKYDVKKKRKYDNV